VHFKYAGFEWVECPSASNLQLLLWTLLVCMYKRIPTSLSLSIEIAPVIDSVIGDCYSIY